MKIKEIFDYAIDCGLTPICARRILKGNDVCRIYYIAGNLVIAFDGSNDLKDWISNFRFIGSSHCGFVKSAEKFRGIIDKYLPSFTYSEIIITGHSRGGAIATLTAEYLSTKYKKECSCVVFGSPMVYKKESRDKYNKLPIDHTLVRNGWDLVTYLPSKALGYRHVGKVMRLKQPWYRKLISFRVRDHFIKSYFRAIKKRYS